MTENLIYKELINCNIVLDQVCTNGTFKYIIYLEYPSMNIYNEIHASFYDYEEARKEFWRVVRSYE